MANELDLLYMNALDAIKKKKFSPERVLAELKLKTLAIASTDI